MLVIRAQIHKMLARIANREGDDQTRVCTVMSRQATTVVPAKSDSDARFC